MIKYVGITRTHTPRSLDLFCENCHECWSAGHFPMSVDTIEAITNSNCIGCGSKNISVMAHSLRPTNVDRIDDV